MPRAQKATETAKQAPAKKAAATGKKDAANSKSSAADNGAHDNGSTESAKPAGAKTATAGKKALASKAAKTSSRPAAGRDKEAVAAAPAKEAAGDAAHGKFLDEQRALLLEEREQYVAKAEELKAEADTLARDSEPGDIQFDEEGGEGNTSNVEREVDLVLSAQARAAVDEIDRALSKIDAGNYGICEKCNKPIPHARLKALPYAALCVQCKSGGLSRR